MTGIMTGRQPSDRRSGSDSDRRRGRTVPTVAVNPLSRPFVSLWSDATRYPRHLANIERAYPIQLLVIPTESLDQTIFGGRDARAVVPLRVVANVGMGRDVPCVAGHRRSGHTAMTTNEPTWRRFARQASPAF